MNNRLESACDHGDGECKGEYCVVHNPVMSWPARVKSDGSGIEYVCPCGVGYPAPEDDSGLFRDNCGNKECVKKYCDAVRTVKTSKPMRHYYDCERCKFNEFCSIGCPCALVGGIKLPPPPAHVIDEINSARIERGGRPYNPEKGI